MSIFSFFLRYPTIKYVIGVAKTSYATFTAHWRRIILTIPGVPVNAIVININESNPWPTTVELIVLDHNHFPFVAIFNLDNTSELINSPIAYAQREAMRSLGVDPRMLS